MKKFFKLYENNVTFRSEALAAFTSYFAVIYIIIVNASILSDSGVNMNPLIIATVFTSVIGCLLVAFISNTPLIIVPGMGINALFTYTLVQTLNLSFYEALTSVFIAGIMFTIIALTPLSSIILKAIPHNLKESITIGIGLFITFIGLQKSKIIVSDASTLLKLGDIKSPEVLTFIVIMVLTLILFLKNVQGSFFISVIIGTIISICFGITDIHNLSFSIPNINDYKEIFFHFDFGALRKINFWIGTFSLTLVLIFENIGIIQSQVSGMLNKPEASSKALVSVAFSTITSSVLGCSPTVFAVEGTAGISAGGKTGVTSIITGMLFLLSIFFIPLISLIPNAAIAPILIIIGCLMAQNLRKLNFDDIGELIPSFITIISIPLTYSIIDGIAFGFILYPICKLCNKRDKKLPIAMYITPVVFLLYFIANSYIH